MKSIAAIRKYKEVKVIDPNIIDHDPEKLIVLNVICFQRSVYFKYENPCSNLHHLTLCKSLSNSMKGPIY